MLLNTQSNQNDELPEYDELPAYPELPEIATPRNNIFGDHPVAAVNNNAGLVFAANAFRYVYYECTIMSVP